MKSKPVYKEKECQLCSITYRPTSPKQKVCILCKKELRKITQARLDGIRNRENYNVSYTRLCKSCSIEFTAYYKKKVYCGSEECEHERIRIKNKNAHNKRSKEELREKGRKYYKNNRIKCLEKKAATYRVEKPNVKEYVGGKINNHNIEFVREYIENKNYKLLSTEYINNREKILLECPEGHKWETSFHGFRDNGGIKGNRCFICYIQNNYTSKFEQSIRDYLKEKFPNITMFYNDRTLIKNPNTGRMLELDILFPCKTKAIECNGIYWHNNLDAIIRDKIKKQQCKKLNIELLILNDKEWNNYQEKCKNKIINFIG